MPSVRVNGSLGSAIFTTTATGLNQTTGVSLAMWERPLSSPHGDRLLFAHGESVTDGLTTLLNGYGLDVNGAALRFVSAGAATRASASATLPSSLASNKWTHYAATFNNSTGEAVFYVNGMCIGRGVSGTLGTTTGAPTTRINLTNGHIADVFDAQVYVDRVLTPTEVLLTMQPNRVVSGCTGRYFGLQFNAPGASGPIRDESGSGNTLDASPIAERCINSTEPDWRRAPLAQAVMGAYALVSAGVSSIAAISSGFHVRNINR